MSAAEWADQWPASWGLPVEAVTSGGSSLAPMRQQPSSQAALEVPRLGPSTGNVVQAGEDREGADRRPASFSTLEDDMDDADLIAWSQGLCMEEAEEED